MGRGALEDFFKAPAYAKLKVPCDVAAIAEIAGR
jgi:hypothetical protein